MSNGQKGPGELVISILGGHKSANSVEVLPKHIAGSGDGSVGAVRKANAVGIKRKSPYVSGMENLKHIAWLCAVSLFLSMAPLHAEESDISWIPEVIDMPEDMEIVTDRRIGSAIRVFTFTTAEDTDVLADRWREALTTGPYQVKPPAEGMDQRLIEFSGGRIQNGQIAFMRGADSTDTTVTFDASLIN